MNTSLNHQQYFHCIVCGQQIMQLEDIRILTAICSDECKKEFNLISELVYKEQEGRLYENRSINDYHTDQ